MYLWNTAGFLLLLLTENELFHLLSLALLQEGWDSVAFLLKVLQKYKHYSMNQSDINFWSKKQEKMINELWSCLTENTLSHTNMESCLPWNFTLKWWPEFYIFFSFFTNFVLDLCPLRRHDLTQPKRSVHPKTTHQLQGKNLQNFPSEIPGPAVKMWRTDWSD